MSEQKNIISAVASLVSMSNEKYEATKAELYKTGEARSESFRNFLDANASPLTRPTTKKEIANNVLVVSLFYQETQASARKRDSSHDKSKRCTRCIPKRD